MGMSVTVLESFPQWIHWMKCRFLTCTQKAMWKKNVCELHQIRIHNKHFLRLSALPDVQVFVKKALFSFSMLTVNYLAMSFYHKDNHVQVRKFNKSSPEHLVASSGIRPNVDGTYQLRKRVVIMRWIFNGHHSSSQKHQGEIILPALAVAQCCIT